MNNRVLVILTVIAIAVAGAVIWWRGRPVNRAQRVLVRAAEVASVNAGDNEINRRIKAAQLRDFTGYELHVDVDGIIRSADLMQDEAIAAWAYVVGLKRILSVVILDLELVSADREKIVVNAVIEVNSDFEKGRYSGSYPVVIELLKVERKLRVSSLKTRL